jgi:hypothetical protein
MKTSLLHARHISLALLIIAAVENGHSHTDYSGASPSLLGLTRLERDLVRSERRNCR